MTLVCDALREAMVGVNAAVYLKPIITSYAIQNRLEDALQLIKDTKEVQLAGQESGDDHNLTGMFLTLSSSQSGTANQSSSI